MMTPTRGSHGKPHRTTKILSHARRRGGVSDSRAAAAAGDAGDRRSRDRCAGGECDPSTCHSRGPTYGGLYRGPERHGRISVGGGANPGGAGPGGAARSTLGE